MRTAEWPVPAGAEHERLMLSKALEAVDMVPCASSRQPDAWWSRLPELVAAAVEGCSGCPVRVECRAYAVAAGEQHGVWGGLSEQDRRELAGRSR